MTLKDEHKIIALQCFMAGGTLKFNMDEIYAIMPSGVTPTVIHEDYFENNDEFFKARIELDDLWKMFKEIRLEVLKKFIETAILNRIRDITGIDVTGDNV